MDRFKYPRTWHLPQSPGLQNDDRRIPDMSVFDGRRVVVTEKIDGENTTMRRDIVHARSPDGRTHPSRDWVKSLWGTIRHEIPEGWRICGENAYALHSLPYRRDLGNALRSYFLAFSVWDEHNVRLGWDDTRVVLETLGLWHVPVLYDGPYTPAAIDQIIASIDTSRQEGFVVTVADPIPYEPFLSCTAKYVRAQHVATDEHWMSGPVIPNELASA